MPQNDNPDPIIEDQAKSSTWDEFFAYVRTIDIPEDWMKDRPMNRIPTVDRTLFSEEDEVVPLNRRKHKLFNVD